VHHHSIGVLLQLQMLVGAFAPSQEHTEHPALDHLCHYHPPVLLTCMLGLELLHVLAPSFQGCRKTKVCIPSGPICGSCSVQGGRFLVGHAPAIDTPGLRQGPLARHDLTKYNSAYFHSHSSYCMYFVSIIDNTSPIFNPMNIYIIIDNTSPIFNPMNMYITRSTS
jgi:hypothetical protein